MEILKSAMSSKSHSEQNGGSCVSIRPLLVSLDVSF